MELKEKYIYAVTQKLAPSQRKDIGEELRGLIEDMLEERTSSESATESDLEEVLTELGNPKELAQKYRGTNNFLIGPELFDSYMSVLKIVMTIVAIVISVAFVIQLFFSPIAILDHFIEWIVSMVTGIPTAFGWTTLSFALAERFSDIKVKDLHIEKEWTPADLPIIPNQKGKIKRSEPITGIIFYTIALLLFTISMNYFGIWIFNDGFTGTIPFINENANFLFLLFIIIILGFGIIKESLKLIYGRWNTQLVVFTFILNFISFIAVILIITQPNFWNPNFMQELVQYNLLTDSSEAYNTITNIWNQTTKWVPIILAMGLVWDAIDGYIKVRKANK